MYKGVSLFVHRFDNDGGEDIYSDVDEMEMPPVSTYSNHHQQRDISVSCVG